MIYCIVSNSYYFFDTWNLFPVKFLNFSEKKSVFSPKSCSPEILNRANSPQFFRKNFKKTRDCFEKIFGNFEPYT
jgi:hypothetical protein